MPAPAVSPSTELVLRELADRAARDPEAYCAALYRLADLLVERGSTMAPYATAAGIAGNALRGAVRAYAFWIDELGAEPELPFDPPAGRAA